MAPIISEIAIPSGAGTEASESRKKLLEQIQIRMDKIKELASKWENSDDLDLEAFTTSIREQLEKLPQEVKQGLEKFEEEQNSAEVAEIPDGPFSWIKDMLTGTQETGRVESLKIKTIAMIQKIKEENPNNKDNPYKLFFFKYLLAIYEAALGDFKKGMLVTEDILPDIKNLINSGYYRGPEECLVVHALIAVVHAIQANILYRWNPYVYREQIQKLFELAHRVDAKNANTQATLLVCQAYMKENSQKSSPTVVNEILKMLKQATVLVPLIEANRASHDWMDELLEGEERLQSSTD